MSRYSTQSWVDIPHTGVNHSSLQSHEALPLTFFVDNPNIKNLIGEFMTIEFHIFKIIIYANCSALLLYSTVVLPVFSLYTPR